MAVITTIIGILLNHVVGFFTNSLADIPGIMSKNTNLNQYEKQIKECVLDPLAIEDRLSFIGGLEDIKEDIQSNILMPLKHPAIFFSDKSSILRPSRGIILYGPPGTGKTMLAKAIAAEAEVPFLSLGLSVLENKYFGESNKLIQATFSLARKMQPCIVFFDELDGLMKQRNDFDQSAVYGFKTELLTQIDGMNTKANEAIFIMGTTNNVNALDPAIKRRMPKLYEIKKPEENHRREIIRLKTIDDNIKEVLVDWVAKTSEGYSGSDLGELVRRASAFRLHEQCQDEKFKNDIKTATCIEDLSLLALNQSHFEKAFLAMGTKIKVEEISEVDEEAPPLIKE